jgi:hypothetical protein
VVVEADGVERQPVALEHRGLEGVDGVRRDGLPRGQPVPRLVEQRVGGALGRGVGRAVADEGVERRHVGVGDRFVGRVVMRVAGEDVGPHRQRLVELGGELDTSEATLTPATRGKATSESSMCSAWPNSWKRMRTSSGVSSAGAPPAGRSMLRVMVTSGRRPVSGAGSA